MHFIESLILKKCEIRYSKFDSNDKGHKNSKYTFKFGIKNNYEMNNVINFFAYFFQS